MKYSIIIPAFGNASYLMECLQSVEVSFKELDYEILLGIDNCPNTLKAVDKLKRFANIRIFNAKENVGPYVIKNSLCQIANGDHFVFFDSDDIMLGELGDLYSKSSVEHDYIRFKFDNFKIVNNEKVIRPSNLSFAEGCFGISKDLFKRLSCFESWRCAADSEFYIRARELGFNYVILEGTMFHRRLHDNNLTVSALTNHTSELRRSYTAKLIKMQEDKIFVNPPLVTVELAEL